MKKQSKYYKDLNIIRLISCVLVFLYHLGILKGGYLAVSSFFVLSGYLGTVSLFKKEKISLKDYYVDRLKHIYLPLIIVVFISIFAVTLLSNYNWINLKPEVRSIILGYNNYWQLSANLDYFKRHIDSPFMHLWYISIIMEFDLIFPLIFIAFKKLTDKVNKYISCIVLCTSSLLLTYYFYISSNNLMYAYYSTETRIFSLLHGVTIGFIYNYFNSLSSYIIKNEKINKIIFYVYMAILILLTIFIDPTSEYHKVGIILASLITLRLINYGTVDSREDLNKSETIIKSLSKITYEIYLVQYPVIFLMQYTDINEYLKIILCILITVVLSAILHASLIVKKEKKIKITNVGPIIILFAISLFGLHTYIMSEDHTKELKALEKQLLEQEKKLSKKHDEYLERIKEENNNLSEQLNNLNNSEQELETTIKNARVTGIGDSVMLGAVDNLYEMFPNGYFDAAISRTAWVANGILENMATNNLLGDIVVVNLGANGDCTTSCKKEIMSTIGENRKVFWLNVTNDQDVDVNADLYYFSSMYDNLYIIDWNGISYGHPEYFIADGIHLTSEGRIAYTNAIYNSIYNVYSAEYLEEKEELLNEYDKKMKELITFYGNDLLLNTYEYIKDDYTVANFIIDKEMTFETLKNKIQKSIEDETITYNIVFAFDNKLNIKESEYKKLISLCKDNKIYIINSQNNKIDIDNENVTIIDIYDSILSNEKYMMVDGEHLNSKGNEKLSKIIKENI